MSQLETVLNRIAGLEETLEERITEKFDLLMTQLKASPPRGRQQEEDGKRKYLTTREFADEVQKDRATISRYCKEGRIKAVRSQLRRGPRETWRIPVSEVARFLDEGPLPVTDTFSPSVLQPN